MLALVATAKPQCYNTPYLATAGNWIVPLDHVYLDACFVSAAVAQGATGANSVRYDTPNQLKAATVTQVSSGLIAVWHTLDCQTVLFVQTDTSGNDSAYFSCSDLPECMLTIISMSTDTVLVQPFAPPTASTGIPYQCDVLGIGDPLGAGETPTYLTFPYAERVEKYPLPVGKYFEVWRDRRKSKIIWVQ